LSLLPYSFDKNKIFRLNYNDFVKNKTKEFLADLADFLFRAKPQSHKGIFATLRLCATYAFPCWLA